ncbi:unnamed protein product [Timema podura]|uniref:Uncharacterized protein n=1 Tax=Timema podura TaxID=61482 RepID=A0ABN7NQW2_TIMPD|nr:unnamed protein product [Timema podura]
MTSPLDLSASQYVHDFAPIYCTVDFFICTPSPLSTLFDGPEYLPHHPPLKDIKLASILLPCCPGAGVVSAPSAPPPPVGQPPTPSRRVVSCYNTPMAMLASTHSHEQEVNSISEKKNALREKLEQLEERAAIKSREMMELKQTVLKLQQQQDWQLTNVPPPATPKVDPSLEGIKAAMDNILVKCRTKDQMITAMADELNRQRRSSAMERVLIDVATDKANMVPDFDRARLHEYLQCVSTLIFSRYTNIALGQVTSGEACFRPPPLKHVSFTPANLAAVTTHPRPRTVPESAQHETPGFPKGLAVLRRINPNTLLLGWDPPAPTITGIIGYDVDMLFTKESTAMMDRNKMKVRRQTQFTLLPLDFIYSLRPANPLIPLHVYVNGNIQERVRSATRNRTLLHGLDLTRKMDILVYAVTPKGKFADPAFVSYQDTVDRPSGPITASYYPFGLYALMLIGLNPGRPAQKSDTLPLDHQVTCLPRRIAPFPGQSFLSEPHGPMPMIQRYQHGGIPHKVVRTSELCSRVRNEEYEPRVRYVQF